jgi:hypothetical protein
VPDAGNQHLRIEGLDEHARAARRPRSCVIDRIERAGEQDHRNVCQRRRLPHVQRDLVSVTSRHADVGEEDIGRIVAQPEHRRLAIADRDDVDGFIGKRLLDDALDRETVVSQQEFLSHLDSG